MGKGEPLWNNHFISTYFSYPRGRSNLYANRPISGAAVIRKFSRNQKSKRKIKIAFQNSFEVAKTAIFMAKPLKNTKNTPLRSILIFDFNSNENQNLFKNSKISKIRRYRNGCRSSGSRANQHDHRHIQSLPKNGWPFRRPKAGRNIRLNIMTLTHAVGVIFLVLFLKKFFRYAKNPLD